MQYQIILSHKPEGGYDVFTPVIPQWTVAAKTREEGIIKARNAISDFVNRSEVISIDISSPQSNGHATDVPWEWFGIGQDDPSWEKLFDEIEKNRDAMFADESITE